MIYAEARECADQINFNVINIRRLIVELHDRDGYTALGHKTWEECVQREFKQAQRYIFYQYQAAEIELNVSDCTMVQLGTIPERQLRPLSKIKDPQQQREVWQYAVETAPEGKVTAAHVSKVVKERTTPKPEPELQMELKLEPREPTGTVNQQIIPQEPVGDSFRTAYEQIYNEIKRAEGMAWSETSREAALEMIQTLLELTGTTGR